MSFSFSLSKSKKNVVSTARVIQFPVKVAFAATAHKIQGQTIKKPKKVVVDLMSVFQAAMAYVMLSRVESIEQLYILETFDESKIYANQQAIKEFERMNSMSVNKRPTVWNSVSEEKIRISVLNCGSLRTKKDHIEADPVLMLSDVICLTETWLWQDEDTSQFDINSYDVHHNSHGKGRGVTVYYKSAKFGHIIDIQEEKIQVSKLSGVDMDIIVVYRAPNGNDGLLRDHLKNLIDNKRMTLVCGDFNMCYVENRKNRTTTFLLNSGFKQQVEEATHIDGGHIDHAYLRTEDKIQVHTHVYSPYYTSKDHDAICLSIDNI